MRQSTSFVTVYYGSQCFATRLFIMFFSCEKYAIAAIMIIPVITNFFFIEIIPSISNRVIYK